MRPAERTESGNRRQSRERNRLHHSGKVACDIVATLPNSQDVDSVINPDRKNKAESQHI